MFGHKNLAFTSPPSPWKACKILLKLGCGTPPVRGAAIQPLLQTIPGPTQEWASISLQVVGLSESIELFEVLFVDLAKKIKCLIHGLPEIFLYTAIITNTNRRRDLSSYQSAPDYPMIPWRCPVDVMIII